MKNLDKNELKEIKAGYGLGMLKFGISRAEVEKLLGKPDEIEEHSYSDTDDDVTETWHYDELELSLEFDKEEDWKLITMSVSSEFYEFMGKSLISVSEDKLISAFEELKIEDFEEEELSPIENPSQKLISLEDLGINFWFDNDVLLEIQWCVLFIDDDTIDWPK